VAQLAVNILILLALALIIFASIAAWVNTQTILRDLTEIKERLGIKEEKNQSFCRRQVEFYTFCSFSFYTSAEKMLFRFFIR
jgi:hypothetical protein